MLNRAALLALVMVTAACGAGDKAAGPKPRPGGGAPVERHLIYEKVIGEKGIWIAEADGSRPRLLVAEGNSPELSPDVPPRPPYWSLVRERHPSPIGLVDTLTAEVWGGLVVAIRVPPDYIY